MSIITDARTRRAARNRTLVDASDVVSRPAGSSDRKAERTTLGRTTEGPDFPTVSVIHPMGPVIDQGEESHCVGFSIAAIIMAALDPGCSTAVGNRFGVWCYQWVLPRGGNMWMKYPGGGNLGLLGCENDLIVTYGGASSVEELAHVVCDLGPTTIGARWHDSMFYPRGGNVIVQVEESTELGHALCIRGFDPARSFGTKPALLNLRVPSKKRRKRKASVRARAKRIRARLRANRRARANYIPQTCPAFLLRNSWGVGWGDGGDAWIKASDLAIVAAISQPDGSMSIARSTNHVTEWAPGVAPGVSARLSATDP